jgi:uncharacterized circularly permuted ATP-grasp superfamily protein
MAKDALLPADGPLDGYRHVEGAYDEGFDGDGPRAHAELALEAVAAHDLAELQERVSGRVRAAGVGFSSADGDEDFLLDAVPRVLEAGEWARLEAGLAQRVRALDRFLADVYGERRSIAEGVVPERVVAGAELLEPGMQGVRPPGDAWVGLAGLDVVRGADGVLRVLEDNCRTPSGLAYAVAARQVVAGALGDERPEGVRPLDGAPSLLAGALRRAAPEGGEDLARAAVLTDGPSNAAFWEHRWLSEALVLPLLTPGELELRGDRLMRRDGGEPLDVVYRRTNADTLDSDVGALLAGPLRAGTLGVVNAFGAGVADDKLVHAYVEDLIRFLLGEEPLLPSVETFDLARPERLEEALDRLDELVVKPRAGYGGEGVVICPHAEPAEVERVRAAVQADPSAFVAQPLVALSTHPTVIDGRLEPRHVDLRPFVALTDDGPKVLPGVALEEGELVVNSSQNGGAKDTWVLCPAAE